MNKDILRENRTHGNSLFPLALYFMNCSSDNILDCHWHDEFEFLTVTEGKALFLIGTNYFEVNKGETIFINSGEIHAGYQIENNACSYTAVVFNPTMLYNSDVYDPIKVKFIDPILNNKYKLIQHINSDISWSKNILTKLNEIVQATEARPFAYEIFVKARLYDIFSILLSNISAEDQHNSSGNINYKTERLKRILEYIHENYSEKISLSQLASYSNMSEGHLCRFFKSMVRKTPFDYINYYRVNKAATLLLDSSKKVIEVSSDVGFENCSYFISTFKQYMKCTPSEYRDQNKMPSIHP